MVSRYTLRPAIAMIELIFALVIMGITLMSAPMLLNMSIQSSNTAMQQESIAAASSQISLILTHAWDEGNTNGTTGYGILNTTGDTELNSTNRWHYSRIYNTGLGMTTDASAAADFIDANLNNDIDDFNRQTRHVTLYNASEVSSITDNEGEYLKGVAFNMISSVKYVVPKTKINYSAGNVAFNKPSEDASPTTSSIKYVNVTLTDTTGQAEHNQSVSLYAFSCNIGDGFIPTKRVGDATR